MTKRVAGTAALLVALSVLSTCFGCSTSPYIQTPEIRPQVRNVVEYHDRVAPTFLDADEVSTALSESAALLSALDVPEISRDELRMVLAPVLTRYAKWIERDEGLSDLEKRIRRDDVAILKIHMGDGEG